MVDTQADVSIIKINSINSDVQIDENEIIQLKGITDGIIYSLGTAKINLIFNDHFISHKFNIVNEEFPIPSNGIIGKDFIQKHFCKLDYFEMEFTIRANKFDIIVPMNGGPSMNTIAIPARAEVFRMLKIKNFYGISLVKNREIANGIFIANTIIHEQNPILRVINTTEKNAIIPNLIEEVEPIENYDIFKIEDVENTDQRVKKLNNIFAKNTPHNKLKLITTLCKNYTDIFTLETDKMTTNNFYEQKIRINDETPVYSKNYRIAHGQKAEIDKQVDKLLTNELIEPSLSPFNSPIILVPKKSLDNKEKKWRLCIDYRKINKKLIPDKYPLPRIDVILDGLGKAKYFSTLDLFSGFHQIPLEKRSREITAFSTEKGIFQWKVLPFGLNISPNSFCRMMAIAFSGLKPEQCFLYVDDIIVLGNNEHNHIDNLKTVFDRCRKYNLKLNPEKCIFFKCEITYLGHKCTDHGILPDDLKIEAVKKYPKPTDKASVKSFTAFMNYYRRFIENFADIARPLHQMTGKNVTFEWTEECENAFQTLKNKLLNPPILQYPNFNEEFIITVDASNFACGAVLSQNIDGNDLPIAYISRSFQKGEKNKPIIEKELLGIHFAVKTFEPYIWGKHFTIRTDHKPLVHLYNLKNPTSKLSLIRMDLETFNFTIVYIPGKLNVTADALSRITIDDLTKIYENNVTMLMTTSKPVAIHIDTLRSVFSDNKILQVTTRSKTRKNAQTKDSEKKDSETKMSEEKIIKYMPVIEEFNEIHLKSVPTVITNAQDAISAQINKNKILFWVDPYEYITNENVSLERLLFKLEKLASEFKINKLKWPMNDKIFTRVTVETFKQACHETLKTLSISLIKPIKIIENEREKKELIKLNHDDPLNGGHKGQKKLLASLRTKYKWKKMEKDVAAYTNQCKKCKLNKIQSHTREAMVLTPTPQKPFDTIIVDTIGPLQKTEEGYEYAVTAICDLSKYLVTVPVTDKSAKSIAKAIFENLILQFGPINNIRTDRGTEYNNKLINEICNLLNIRHDISTAYHHQTVGSIERNHRTLNEYIRIYVTNIAQWDEYMQYYTYCYNTSKHDAFNNNYSPYELVFGKSPRDMNNILTGDIEPVYNIENYANELKFKLQLAHKQAQDFMTKNKEISKKYYDRKINSLQISIGDKIKIEKEPRNKHKPIFDGPYTVSEINDTNITYIDNLNKKQTIHKNRAAIY